MLKLSQKQLFVFIILIVNLLTAQTSATTTPAFADVILDYYDSGAGPMAGPYGGTEPGGPGWPIPIMLEVVLGNDPGPTGFDDFLSLPTGSFVVVGFTDETIIDNPGDDLFIKETGAAGEKANVYVSSDGLNFTFLGVADNGTTTSFDLADIGFTDPVFAVKVKGLDNLGGSPGFDIHFVKALSIGPQPDIPGYQSTPIEINGIIDFGTVFIGETAHKAFQIREIGNADLTVALSEPSIIGEDAAYFSLLDPPFPFTIVDESGLEETVTVICTPVVEKDLTAELVLKSNDPINTSITYILKCHGKSDLLAKLGEFKTVRREQSILVQWSVAQFTNHAGFHLWRALKNSSGEYTDIVKLTDELITEDSSGQSERLYTYEDFDIVPGNVYYYALEEVELDGNTHINLEFITSGLLPTTFSAFATTNQVYLKWQSTTSDASFHVLRARKNVDGAYRDIIQLTRQLIPVQTDDNYSYFIDQTVVKGETYYYALVDAEGVIQLDSVVSALIPIAQLEP